MTMSTTSVTALVSHTQGRMDRGAAEPCFARRAATVVGNRVREAVFSTVKRTMLSEAMLPQLDSFFLWRGAAVWYIQKSPRI